MTDNLDENGFARGGIVGGPVRVVLSPGDYIVPLGNLRLSKKDATLDAIQGLEDD